MSDNDTSHTPTPIPRPHIATGSAIPKGGSGVSLSAINGHPVTVEGPLSGELTERDMRAPSFTI